MKFCLAQKFMKSCLVHLIFEVFSSYIYGVLWNRPHTKLQNENVKTFEHSLQHNYLLGHNDNKLLCFMQGQNTKGISEFDRI